MPRNVTGGITLWETQLPTENRHLGEILTYMGMGKIQLERNSLLSSIALIQCAGNRTGCSVNCSAECSAMAC